MLRSLFVANQGSQRHRHESRQELKGLSDPTHRFELRLLRSQPLLIVISRTALEMLEIRPQGLVSEVFRALKTTNNGSWFANVKLNSFPHHYYLYQIGNVFEARAFPKRMQFK